MTTPKSLPGMDDILPEEIEKWQAIEQKAREIFDLYNYSEIRTPILEEISLFCQSVGQDTDIVQKEMFSFGQSGGEKEICLRPEQTASVIRAYIEHNVAKKEGLTKYYYSGPMFRKEKPQKGRKRQFHQIGVEAIGSNSIYLDAEIISLANDILRAVKIDNYQIEISSVGCPQCQADYKSALREYFQDKIRLLCPDCEQRFKRNIMRILDCKKENCQIIIKKAPRILDYLCHKCDSHFKKVQDALDLIVNKVNYVINPRIVRGLDYYTNTVFEITHSNLGSQNALAAGGRYNGLIEQMGGEPQPAVGFSLGIERVISVAKLEANNPSVFVCFIPLGEEAYVKSYKIMHQLRQKGIACEIDYQNKSLKAQMRIADRLKAKFVVILGEKELEKGIITLRDMETKKQEEIEIRRSAEEIAKLLTINRQTGQLTN